MLLAWQAFDEMLKDGMMETGDIMEQRGPRTFVWIDRKKNTMKLSQARSQGHPFESSFACAVASPSKCSQ